MPLSTGARLGPYEIIAPLGAGGMGEVYKAIDTRLDRTVALKVLAPALASRDDFRQRFLREARIISSLNHSHICQLFDLGRHQSMDFLVMEYLEGETLAARIGKSALPVEQAMRYGIEIADALDCAHRQRIIHRDLKPGNIMITASGVKLLDFGRANFAAPQQAVHGVSVMPTETAGGSLTVEGSLLGTPEYMSPEQLEGNPADARSDLFAFGLVLFEMISGRKAFTGKTRPGLMAAILESEPPGLDELVPGAPLLVGSIVTSCLAKQPERRWQSAADLHTALKWAIVAKPVAMPTQAGHRLLWAVACIVLLAGTLFALFGLNRPPPPSTLRFNVSTTSSPISLAVSPDGSQIAFAARDSSGQPFLWVRPLDAAADRKFAGTEGATEPFWSPDGRLIGFFAAGKLKKVAVTGGPPQVISRMNNELGATWNSRGDIVVAPWNRLPLHRVTAAGGDLESITALDSSKENSHRWPQFLPDGNHFLFTARGALETDTAAYVGSLDSRKVRRVLAAHSNVAYAPPGRLLFVQEGTLMAQPCDARIAALSGEAVPVAEGVRHTPPSAQASFSVSANGQVLAWLEATNRNSNLFWFDRSGKKLSTLGAPDGYSHARLSPDGKRVATVLTDPDSGNRDIWLIDTSTAARTRFTINQANDWHPVWSPDGSRIAFASDRNGMSSIYWKPSTGTTEEEPLAAISGGFPRDFSRDGRYLAFDKDTNSRVQLGLLRLSLPRNPVTLLEAEFMLGGQRFSPNSKWLAYGSLESGVWEIYVRPVETTNRLKPRWKISSGGGYQPFWRAEGRELVYLAPDATVMVADVKSDSDFEASSPRPLFRLCPNPSHQIPYESSYGIAPDGRFLAVCPSAETSPSSIEVVTNWQAKLSR